MNATKRLQSGRVWNDHAFYVQIIIRRISIISASFTIVAEIWVPTPQRGLIIGLSVVYIAYNLMLCIRRTKPKLAELAVNLALCAGLTVTGAVYSNVLYHLLLMRMVLKVGGDRARRMAMAVMVVYVAANTFRPDVVTVPLLLEIIYNVIAFAVLSFTAVYMHNVIANQLKHEGKIAELMQENARHYEMAHTDELTGLLNHLSYLEKTGNLSQYVLLVVDIDHFKKLNDTYGHLFGDHVLTTVANIIKLGIRSKDMAFRYGGEEFAIVLPGASLELGMKIAERLRYQVANCDFFHKGERVKITISIGVSRKDPSEDSEDAFHEADSALYRAKRQGRNQCAVF